LILIVTNKFDPHADRVIGELNARAVSFARFNTEDFPSSVAWSVWLDDAGWRGRLALPRGDLELSQVTSVWYRRPQPSVISDAVTDEAHRRFCEDQCKAAIGGLWHLLSGAYWISPPHTIAAAERKLYQLQVATRCGFDIPRTVITNRADDAVAFTTPELMNRGVAAKAVGFSPEFGLRTRRLSDADITALRDVQYAPVILQEYVPKAIEVRATVVAGTVFAAEIHSQENPNTAVDWRHYDLASVRHAPHDMPALIERKCLRLVRELGLAFGAIDLVLTPSGRYVFLEINPNGQWLWIEDLTGLSIARALAQALVQPSANIAPEPTALD
jgi:glutathione synthase/RimK-type ligase-like ATP-grasp enzyme